MVWTKNATVAEDPHIDVSMKIQLFLKPQKLEATKLNKFTVHVHV